MKKILLLLLVCFCQTVSAQVLERTATFDFATPSSLNPPFIPESGSGGVLPLETTTFTDGLMKMTFGRLTPDNIPAQMYTYVNPYSQVASYYLRINSGSMVTFSGSSVVIKKIQFFDDGDFGTYSPLKMANLNQPGSVINGVWTSGETSVTQVSFSSNAKPSYISKAIVTYEEPSIVLIPTVTPADGAEVGYFQTMTLTFDSPMTVQPAAANITLTGQYEDGNQVFEKPTISGGGTTAIVLNLQNKIEKDGSFVVNIPAQSFRNAAGYENVALTYHFTVKEPRNTFNPESVDPENNSEQTELKFPITLQFPDIDESYVGTVDEAKTFNLSRMKENGTWTVLGELKVVKGSKGQVMIENVTARDSYTTLGVYKIEIPESVVYNQFSLVHASSRHNAALELIYTVVEPVDPLKEKKDSVALLVSEVNSLLTNSVGKLGYPINASGLNEVKGIAVADTDDEAKLTEKINKLLEALKAFYNDTEIVLPQKDKWYTIASVNKDGNKLYLTYANGAVTLGTKASAYKVNDINGKIVVFETADGKFLHVLIGTNDYDLTSTANVTNEKKYVNDLTLGKMLLAGDNADQKPVLGLFTIKGGLGLNKETSEKVGDAYALVVHSSTPSIATSLKETTLYFESDKTSAFKLVETVEPIIEVVKAQAVLDNPELTSNTQVMTLEIKGMENDEDVTKVALKSLAGVKFTYMDGDEEKVATTTANPILKPIEGTTNQFEVHADGLADNTYELVMLAGTFDFSQNPKTVEDADLKVSFKVQTSGSGTDSYVNYGSLPEMWGTIPTLIQGFPIADTDLLEVYYYVTAIDIYPNKDAAYNVVKLYERWTNTFIAQGHFESVRRDGQYMLKIVYDESTSLVDKLPLPNSDYTLIVGRAAYGDENFNKRQNGDISIAESDCRVNQRVLYNNLTVVNGVTGIKDFNGDKQLSDGKYVIDGRFVIVKNGKKFTATGVALY